MMNRVYGKEIGINKEAVKDFWENREKAYNEEHPYVSIKLNDKNPELSEIYDKCEKEEILPLLHVNKDSYVVDIGCGIGRLAEDIIDNCKYYLGTDVAEGLVKIAEKRIITDTEHDFMAAAFQDIDEKRYQIKYLGKYNKAIIAGVFIFINDEEINLCLEKLLTLLDKNAAIYIATTIALDERLTLTDWQSQDFEQKYNAIYRTMEEYDKLFKPLYDAGFHIKHEDYFSYETNRFKETKRYYFIFER